MNEQVQNMLFGTDNQVMWGFTDPVQSLLNCLQTRQPAPIIADMFDIYIHDYIDTFWARPQQHMTKYGAADGAAKDNVS